MPEKLHNLKNRLAVSTTVGVAALAGAIEASPAELHSRDPNRHPVTNLLRGVDDIKVKSRVNVLNGKTANLIIDGAAAYTKAGRYVTKVELPDCGVIHAAYSNKGGEHLAGFRLGGKAYVVRLDDPTTRRHIKEFDPAPGDKHPYTPFHLSDISTETVTVTKILDYNQALSPNLHNEPYGNKYVPVAQANN